MRRIAAALTALSLFFVPACDSQSHADTPAFPDMSDWTAVDVNGYEVDTTTPGRPSTGTYFLAPDGIICGFATFPPAAGCTAETLPGVPPLTDPKPGIFQTIPSTRSPSTA